jgi:hypothetical protein
MLKAADAALQHGVSPRDFCVAHHAKATPSG